MNIQEWFPLGLIDVLGWFRFFLRMLWNKTEWTFWPTQCQQKCREIISLLRELQLKAPAILWIWGWRAARVGWVGVEGYWELNQSGAKGLQVLPPTFFSDKENWAEAPGKGNSWRVLQMKHLVLECRDTEEHAGWGLDSNSPSRLSHSGYATCLGQGGQRSSTRLVRQSLFIAYPWP